MQQTSSLPSTLNEAVLFLVGKLPPQSLHLIRGGSQTDLAGMHFQLGMWIRNELGLHDPRSLLLRSCGVANADAASSMILNQLWQHLQQTSTDAQLAESREMRKQYAVSRARERQELIDAKVAKDAAITEARCPNCGKPCPSYRKTCKYCGKPATTL